MKRKGVTVNVAYPSKKSKNIVKSKRPKYYRVQGRSTGALVAQPERKYFDSVYAATAMVATAASWASAEVDPGASVLNLCSPGPGSGINQRIGRKINVLSLKIHGYVSYTTATGAATVGSYPRARVICVLDQQTNGAQLNAEDVMASTGAAVDNQIEAFMNLGNLGRFRVLKDKTFTLGGGNSGGESAGNLISTDFQGQSFKWNIKFAKPITVHFNATGTALVADIVDNSFHMIALADTTNVTLSYAARACYVDA